MTRFAARSLRIRYPAQRGWALDRVDLEIEPGRVTWLTGALGSGTSTLLLALAGLTPRLTGGERAGNVTADDRDSAELHPLLAGIAYLSPSPALQLSGIAATVRQEIAVGPMNLGWPRERIRASVTAALARLDVAHLADRAPGTLSGGETQRILLAALLAAEPRAWLLDEPFSALDYGSRARAAELFHELAVAGAAVVVACDDADAMVDTADRLIVMRHGRIALDGAPRELLGNDAMLAAGAGTTDAAALAHDAGFASPRPITVPQLLAWVRGRDERAMTSLAPSGAAGAPVLAFNDVTFGYRDGPAVIERISLTICRAEAVGLFGANGSGKSTLLRLAMALEHPRAGIVETLQRATTNRQPEDFAPRVGFLFQQPERQLFAASVRAECAVAARLAGWPRQRVDAAVGAVLEQLRLGDVADEHPYDLPLPRRRLVALASVLVADPDLLLLDEPTAALDAASRDAVIGVVRERIGRGRAVFSVTHDATFAHEALDRAIQLDRGRLVHDGRVRDVLDDRELPRPAALAVALALGMLPGEDRRKEVAQALARRRL